MDNLFFQYFNISVDIQPYPTNEILFRLSLKNMQSSSFVRFGTKRELSGRRTLAESLNFFVTEKPVSKSKVCNSVKNFLEKGIGWLERRASCYPRWHGSEVIQGVA